MADADVATAITVTRAKTATTVTTVTSVTSVTTANRTEAKRSRKPELENTLHAARDPRAVAYAPPLAARDLAAKWRWAANAASAAEPRPRDIK